MDKNVNIESCKLAMDYMDICIESIERNKRRIERQKQKLEELKQDNTLYSVAEEYDIRETINKCYCNINIKKEELKTQLDFIKNLYEL